MPARYSIVLFATLAASCGGHEDPELSRHEKAFNGTYMVPMPWQEPRKDYENPEDAQHLRSVPGRG
jgi:hypothetical protein